MTPLFNKLNLGEHREILILGAPDSFESELLGLAGVTIRRDKRGTAAIPFTLIFVQTLAEVEAAADALLPKALGDAVVWFAYPKASSKRYHCEFNRDNGWAAVVKAGFESVRMVAIDEDWSALRFRRSEYVKNRAARPGAAKVQGRRQASGDHHLAVAASPMSGVIQPRRTEP